ncbi:uncharacterized protein LOC131159335 isoform X2 [Malania oleifera]|uniref:uncharacterized protein LOC131159335 isoform X2 n=1 Tax=Malania oleifera TaxID=397392 RepID=UPI0025AE1CCD|nr:uncharacterized protein LOC131159335 isoform X2 [Malania oleifera]
MSQHASSCSSSAIATVARPICLGPVTQESYLDRCFHKFCYNCIVHWTKVVAGKHCHPLCSLRCPLCKTENFSIIHGYDGSSFQRHYVNQDIGNNFSLSKAQRYRLQCYYTESGVLNDKFNVSRYWTSHKYLQQNQWLHNWLEREIQALTQEEDVDIIVHHVLGVIDSFRRRNEQLRSAPEEKQETFESLVLDAARPFLSGRAERFVNEIELFLASGLNIEAYDEVYMQQLGWITPKINSEDKEGESHERKHFAPYLYFFEEDSNETN